MRIILLILAAYAFVAWNDARAECQRFEPGRHSTADLGLGQ